MLHILPSFSMLSVAKTIIFVIMDILFSFYEYLMHICNNVEEYGKIFVKINLV